ncbi:glutathione S-transferase family protein [Zavarzinia aquatilis]|uniref:Glutathione S-transferase n=1 Tax=Zavarzinia aquatilis TaxID=2211142 RepID=A0A317EJV9_9PROT|nr:glutathione S-transferase family protein [Zavarzinia aquatilis]PWR25703.1 glutathione S-transferase [Zavarzinia aquatilis]
MIDLHQFPPAWGINPSPFCLKLETFFRLARVDYRAVETLPFLAPKGKLPFITDQGTRIADSATIIAHMKSVHGIDLDAGLDETQRARAHLLRRTIEESLYFVLLYARWIDEAGWSAARPAFFGAMPPGIRHTVPHLIRRGIGKTLKAQGYGRHAPADIYALGIADLDAIAGAITADGFAVAGRPTAVDATLYAFLSSILDPPIDNPLKRHAAGLAPLAAYLERMAAALA